jgi:glucose/arabinose dehydrogenase
MRMVQHFNDTRKSRFVTLVLLALWCNVEYARPQNPPNTPVITEPTTQGQMVNAADVHMETRPMSDHDPGDTHHCSDWEINTLSSAELIWEASCRSGVEKTHIHLGDGAFRGSHANRTELFYDTSYRLRVRHQDNTGLWSSFAQLIFRTGFQRLIFPLELDDATYPPSPRLLDENGAGLILPPGATPAAVRMESNTNDLLLKISGHDGASNLIDNPPPLATHAPVRVVIEGGSAGIILPPSSLAFTDGAGIDRAIYLPLVNVAPAQQAYFWISANGSSYIGTPFSTPDFSRLARSLPLPWKVLQAGYQIEVVAQGLRLPVNIAFNPNTVTQPSDPYFYVTELYGTIKVVTRDGTISDYADSLLNFNPSGAFPGSGEQGLSGIIVDPATGDVFASLLYDAAPPNGPHYPKVVRFHSNDNGLTSASQTTILDMPGESQGQSHFVSNLTIGPDGKLYVHMGDGFEAATALNLNSFRGKILRSNPDGTAPEDNPWYDASNGITAIDYVYAYGFRNPFGGDWRAADGFHYEVENGPDIDRFAKVVAGASYGWNGTRASMTTNALYVWSPAHSPVNLSFIQPQTFGGSGFPAEKMDHVFITESGPTWASGPQPNGKRIVEFELDAGGNIINGPATLVEYHGAGKATAVGLAAGPDGLYFTDLYKDQDYGSPIDRGANILLLKFVGNAGFTADITAGVAPLTVQFTDLSDVPSPLAWRWNFGDSASSPEQNPRHEYVRDGGYNVRLAVTGNNGVAVVQKNAFIVVGEATGVDDEPDDRSLPAVFSLQQNYPNPFNPATTIKFSISRESRIRVSIHDVLGHEVVQLVNEIRYRAGAYSTTWHGTNARGAQVGSGVYLCRMTAMPLNGGASYIDTKKMLLMR